MASIAHPQPQAQVQTIARPRAALSAADARLLDRDAVAARFGDRSPDSADVTQWLNALEEDDGLVVYLNGHPIDRERLPSTYTASTLAGGPSQMLISAV